MQHKKIKMPYMDDYVSQALGQSSAGTDLTKKKDKKETNTSNSNNNSSSSGTNNNTSNSNNNSSSSGTNSDSGLTADQQKWINGLPPVDEENACTRGCAQDDIVRAKECENIRLRTAKMLEQIGCPSDVTAKSNSGSGGTCGNSGSGGTCGNQNTCSNQNTCGRSGGTCST